ncbi:MAG: 2OG-Fe(II) oxygenase [Myxococcales bacterium FL481]|nr:MAG: 2OG-Fe(II) oxygenase [Myxococcales bacterium FL481]
MSKRPRPFGRGDPVPWFDASMAENPRFSLSMLGGHWVVLVFLGRLDLPESRRFVEQFGGAELEPREDIFRCAVTMSPNDAKDPQVIRAFPHGRVIGDARAELATTYRVATVADGKAEFVPRWYLLDPSLRVYANGKLDQVGDLITALRQLPAPDQHFGPDVEPWAPVLLVPRVLEPALCRDLITWHQRGHPVASGFMVTEGGATVLRADTTVKRRRDVTIDEPNLRAAVRRRIRSRIAPEIAKAFRFEATQIERDIVCCYSDEEGGFFRSHRDDTSPGTAHRRFAVTINLNPGEYEGGELRFPEYGARLYSPPLGGAVVFSCALLHEVLPVTSGRRYASVPFLYDDAAARQRSGFVKSPSS